jgi:transposase InsO family protein
MNFITGLPPVLYEGKVVETIFVIINRFLKWLLFILVPSTINAAELAELFHTKVELQFGPPNGIVSDRGPIFTSNFWSELCYHSHIHLRLSTAFHPQTDGQTKRINQILKHYLRCFIDEQQLNWPLLLPTAQFACNNAVNSTTGLPPFQVLYSYSPDFHLRTEDGTFQEEVPAVQTHIKKLDEMRKHLKEHWQKAVQSQMKHHDLRHKHMTFKRGDLVALSTRNLKLKTPSSKLSPKFIGPFRVLDVIGTQAYRLSLLN